MACEDEFPTPAPQQKTNKQTKISRFMDHSFMDKIQKYDLA